MAAPPPWTNIRLPGMFKSASEISVEEQNTVINNCYLVLDMYPFSPEITRVRSSIFPDEKELVYVYKEDEDN